LDAKAGTTVSLVSLPSKNNEYGRVVKAETWRFTTCRAAKRMNRVQLLFTAYTTVFVAVACCDALRSSERRVLLKFSDPRSQHSVLN
jgi:hypothetical protein